MKSAQPPKLAGWLLEHFGCSPNNAAVAGDLDEQYRQRPVPLWYWWQATVAIFAGFITEIRIHKLLVLRAVLLGMGFQLLFWYGMHFILRLMPYQWYWEHPYILPRIDIWIIGFACAANGRILGWLHPSLKRTVVFAFVALQFITRFVPINIVRYQMSWIFQVGSGINTLLWNTYGMTALGRICGFCNTVSGYGAFLSVISAFITVSALLLGSGVLKVDTNTSGASCEPTSAA